MTHLQIFFGICTLAVLVLLSSVFWLKPENRFRNLRYDHRHLTLVGEMWVRGFWREFEYSPASRVGSLLLGGQPVRFKEFVKISHSDYQEVHRAWEMMNSQ